MSESPVPAPPRPTRFPLARHRLMRSDFQRIYKRGRRAKGALFTVVVLENELARTRLGLSVAKRHIKRAVDRNRVRRILREAFRLELARLPAGVDVVLISALVASAEHGPPLALAEAQSELVTLVARALAKRPRPGPEKAAEPK